MYNFKSFLMKIFRLYEISQYRIKIRLFTISMFNLIHHFTHAFKQIDFITDKSLFSLYLIQMIIKYKSRLLTLQKSWAWVDFFDHAIPPSTILIKEPFYISCLIGYIMFGTRKNKLMQNV